MCVCFAKQSNVSIGHEISVKAKTAETAKHSAEYWYRNLADVSDARWAFLGNTTKQKSVDDGVNKDLLSLQTKVLLKLRRG